jgi:hypothetical protein
MPPIVVAGLPWSDAEYAADKLHSWGFDIESSKLIPAELDAFVERGGLLVWIQADTAARLRISARDRRVPHETEAELRVVRNAMFEDWRTMTLDSEPHPGYALKLAHIIICHDGDRRRLLPLLREMQRWLATRPSFTPRHTQPHRRASEQLAIGVRQWEMRQFGCRVPKPDAHQYTGQDPGRHRRSSTT